MNRKNKLGEKIIKTRVKIEVLNFVYEDLRCPRCETLCHKHDTVIRYVEDIGYPEKRFFCLFLSVHKCKRCEKAGEKPNSFRSPVDDIVEKWKHYGRDVRQKMKKSVKRDKMTYGNAAQMMREDFSLNIVPSTIWHAVNDDKEEIEKEYSEYQDRVIAEFSGQMSFDEVYLGKYSIVVATDSLNEREIGHMVIKGTMSNEDLKKVSGFLEE